MYAGMSVEIPLTRGKTAIIDASDIAKVAPYKWMFHAGYARSSKYDPKTRKNTAVHMSHIILPCPEGMFIDHINRNKLDNRRCNLRIATRSQNNANRRSFANSKSQYKGVVKSKKTGWWEAAIRKDGKQISLGSYETEIAAASAYNDYARRMWGEYAVLNDIEEVDYRNFRHLKGENCASVYRGVCLRKSGKWVARITLEGKRISLGYFDEEVEAAKAYNAAYEEFYGREGPNYVS